MTTMPESIVSSGQETGAPRDYITGLELYAASSGNVANAAAVVSLQSANLAIPIVRGFLITGTGATAAITVVATLTGLNTGPAGLLSGQLDFAIAIPAGVNVPFSFLFQPPNGLYGVDDLTEITLTVPAAGAGNTNVCAVMWGHYN